MEFSTNDPKIATGLVPGSHPENPADLSAQNLLHPNMGVEPNRETNTAIEGQVDICKLIVSCHPVTVFPRMLDLF